MLVPTSTMAFYTMSAITPLKQEVAQVYSAQHSVIPRYKLMLKKSLVKFSVCFEVAEIV